MDIDFLDLIGGDSGLNPDVSPVAYTGPDLSTFDGNDYTYGPESNYLGGVGAEGSNADMAAALSNAPPSDLQKLASLFGVTLGKDANANITKLISAIGLIRNQGANGANRQAAMSGLSALTGKTTPFTEANTIVGARKPVYQDASKFIVAPPTSAGPLNLIKTSTSGIRG